MAKIEEPDPEETWTWVNQRRDGPLPASHQMSTPYRVNRTGK